MTSFARLNLCCLCALLLQINPEQRTKQYKYLRVPMAGLLGTLTRRAFTENRKANGQHFACPRFNLTSTLVISLPQQRSTAIVLKCVSPPNNLPPYKPLAIASGTPTISLDFSHENPIDQRPAVIRPSPPTRKAKPSLARSILVIAASSVPIGLEPSLLLTSIKTRT